MFLEKKKVHYSMFSSFYTFWDFQQKHTSAGTHFPRSCRFVPCETHSSAINIEIRTLSLESRTINRHGKIEDRECVQCDLSLQNPEKFEEGVRVKLFFPKFAF